MKTSEVTYALSPSDFRSMQEAQVLTDSLEENLHDQAIGAPNIRPQLVEILSELVNNAAEHGMNEHADQDAHLHVRLHAPPQGPRLRRRHLRRKARASAPHWPKTPTCPCQDTDADAIALAIRELVSGTAAPTRGIGLWMTVTEMQKPGRKLWIHSGSGLLTMYGDSPPELRDTPHRQGTMVRLTIPT